MAARNIFIEIYECPYKFITFAHMLGRPHGGAPTGLCRNSQKINSFKNRGFINPNFLNNGAYTKPATVLCWGHSGMLFEKS